MRNRSDADDTYHFAAKSKFAASGRAVQPDHPDSRRLPGGAVAEVESGYQRMLRTLYLGASGLTPEPAARMQVAFDCWIADLEDIGAGDSCATTFHEALAEVEGVCDATLAEACAPAVVTGARSVYRLFWLRQRGPDRRCARGHRRGRGRNPWIRAQ